MLDHIRELEMILWDLRRDSDAYRLGWRNACEACLASLLLEPYRSRGGGKMLEALRKTFANVADRLDTEPPPS
jgi:hypothetical protein